MEINRKIDVVIPVYNAFAVLQNCLASLELYQDGIENIILIDDASSDKNVVNLVRSYSKKNNWNLIKHDKNLGFVKTANEGLKISKNNTILLNSDTVVSEYWIQAFNKLLKNNSTIGTATAWSNNAEICSFPQFLQNNKIPENLNRLSEILYKNYQPQYPEIPTAVGFCMLITKQAKQTIGYFDE
ncbi:MAG: glycosyltransferase family 2 protein, partial [Marinicellaceae bacterium]